MVGEGAGAAGQRRGARRSSAAAVMARRPVLRVGDWSGRYLEAWREGSLGPSLVLLALNFSKEDGAGNSRLRWRHAHKAPKRSIAIEAQTFLTWRQSCQSAWRRRYSVKS